MKCSHRVPEGCEFVMLRTALTVLCIVVVPYESSVAIAQSFPQGQQQPQLLTPEQLHIINRVPDRVKKGTPREEFEKLFRKPACSLTGLTPVAGTPRASK